MKGKIYWINYLVIIVGVRMFCESFVFVISMLDYSVLLFMFKEGMWCGVWLIISIWLFCFKDFISEIIL